MGAPENRAVGVRYAGTQLAPVRRHGRSPRCAIRATCVTCVTCSTSAGDATDATPSDPHDARPDDTTSDQGDASERRTGHRQRSHRSFCHARDRSRLANLDARW